MHHKRVAQEKNRLISDLQRLKKHYSVVRWLCTESCIHWRACLSWQRLCTR